MLFRTQYTTPTDAQLTRICRIIGDWAIVENTFQTILTRLTGAPDWPLGALTDGLSLESRLDAIRCLVEIGRDQFRTLDPNTAEALLELIKEVQGIRKMRNRLAHWVTMRSNDDKILCVRLSTRLPTKDREDSASYTINDLDEHICLVAHIAERAETFVAALETYKIPVPRTIPPGMSKEALALLAPFVVYE